MNRIRIVSCITHPGDVALFLVLSVCWLVWWFVTTLVRRAREAVLDLLTSLAPEIGI